MNPIALVEYRTASGSLAYMVGFMVEANSQVVTVARGWRTGQYRDMLTVRQTQVVRIVEFANSPKIEAVQ